mmetsp:Transcript_21513/g.50153  ORF Transcript_21513/g.50153 Transcript_21513/m.50153 type:complete len:250 (-) Transcript_21513:48-797(-)
MPAHSNLLPVYHSNAGRTGRCAGEAMPIPRRNTHRRLGLLSGLVAGGMAAGAFSCACFVAGSNPNRTLHGGREAASGLVSGSTLIATLLSTASPAAAEEAAASGGNSLADFGFLVFWTVLGLAFLKNNLVDQNGPLAGFFGMEMSTAKVSHILVESQEEASEIMKELKAEKTPVTLEKFQEVAKEKSTCQSAKSGGDLGKVTEGLMDKDFEKLCFDKETALGEPVGPVETKYGHHLVWIEERKMAGANA